MVASAAQQPYLSVVVASRNDGHGGDPLARLQALVDSFAAQCGRFGLDAELVVVEWNPPPDRPRLRDVVRAPGRAPLAVRFIEVPPELHATLPFADVLPLFQMMAKNVGIRRSTGQFVLSTNIDIVFSNQLVEYLATRPLERGRMYRVDRHDIEPNFPTGVSLDEQMAYCASHQLRLHAREGTFAVDRDGNKAVLDPDVVQPPAITLGPGWHVREGDADRGVYRWAAAAEAHLIVDRAESSLHSNVVLELEIAANPYEPDSWVDLEVFDNGNPVARKRIVQHLPHVGSRFAVLLEDGETWHDIVLKLRDVSPSGRRWQSLSERREGLAYRLISARLAVSAYRAACRHEYTSFGPLRAKSPGEYHFALSPAPGDTTLTALDAPDGLPLEASQREVYDRGVRASLLSMTLDQHRFVWLNAPGATRGLHGSADPRDLAPRPGLATGREFVRLLARRAVRRVRRAERRWRSAIAPALREWLDRFDPSPTPDPRPAPDDLSGTTDDLHALRDFLRANRPRYLHLNACGDFQLMAREHWFELRGFAEFATYSMSLDGLLSTAAEHAGIREQVLESPRHIYHLEHEKGSGWTPEGEAQLRRRMAERGITWVEHRMFHTWAASMAWLDRPMIFNGPGWGFADSPLAESTVHPVSHNA